MSEIRFLRKNMGLTGKRLSEVMGVDNATISRWERDFQQPAKAHDHFIRLLHITEKRVSAENTQHARIMKYFNMTEKHGMQLCAILRSSAKQPDDYRASCLLLLLNSNYSKTSHCPGIR